MRVRRIQRRSTVETLYRDHQRIVNHLASKFAKKFGRPFEEMRITALDCLTLQVAIMWKGYYDPSRCKPTTLIYGNIYWCLLNYCTHQRLQTLPLEEIVEEPEHQRSWFERFLEELGAEGRALARVICEAPEELATLVAVRAPVRSKRAVSDYLERRAAWDEEMFSRAWTQVEEALA